jgi:hypothetical protein
MRPQGREQMTWALRLLLILLLFRRGLPLPLAFLKELPGRETMAGAQPLLLLLLLLLVRPRLPPLRLQLLVQPPPTPMSV